MMRSLFSGVSGLKTHQTKMDVIGNNIANVNTVGYKSQSATFSELMYQTTQSASGANADTGRAGINAKQIGLGVKSGAINTSIATSGASQSTGNPFDIQISGSQFFIVNDGQSNFFTRAGTFNIDANGTLCMTTNGYAVMGWQADDEGNIIKNTVSQLQPMSEKFMTSEPQATTETYMSGVIDSDDPQVSSDAGQITTLQFFDKKGYSYTMKFAIKATASEGQFTMEATDILDAAGKSILTNTMVDPAKYPAADPDANKPSEDADKKKAYIAANFNLLDGKDQITLAYEQKTGKWIGVGATKNDGFTLNVSDLSSLIAGLDGVDINVDMTTTSNIANDATSTIAGKTGKLGNTAVGAGRAAGEMDSLSVQQDGKIFATYTNGTNRILGQIAVASFANPSGLEKVGDNLYSATQNSGQFDGVGIDITADGGTMSSGVLEMSNVDLSTEFTEMITTQRGFQANSRIITVSDTMIEELVNLKR